MKSTDVLPEVDSEVELMNEYEGIINFDENNINAIGEGITFLIVKESEMYHVLDIYVENFDIANYANRASVVNRDHYAVFIDIGHGGKDTEVSANGVVEKIII